MPMSDESDSGNASIGPGALLKGRYRLERMLGRGGMASVWLASDETLERPVAVKVLSDTIASDPEFTARFSREARVAAGLSHPNLIGVYDYAEAAERPYLVMEYVPGGNLAELMSQKAAIDCERLARELLGALAHIHAAGIVHRDVKPQNVLIAPDGSAKLIDFGVALPRDATALTRTGHLLGTARYIAPEAMEGKPATERSDLYSFGIVLRDCIGDGSAGNLRALAMRLSQTDPSERPASAQAALSLAMRGASGVADRPTERIRPTPAPRRLEPRRARPTRGATAAVGAALAALATAAIVISGGSQQEGGGQDGSNTRAEARGDGEATPSRRVQAGGAAAVPTPSGDDLALGSELNEEGFELIQAGRPEAAIPVLKQAIRVFPPGTDDLAYAYALFNLGNALRLSGRAAEAIPVLERRLRIPNQAEVVRRELVAARRDASS
jgi:eukaryotic-like serine/threonine-protein kinase